MGISIKSQREIDLMREAGKKLSQVHRELAAALAPGMSTRDIDILGENCIRRLGGIPSFKNYHGYPASVCVSINEEVVHGIPSKKRILEEGDVVSLDVGLCWKGYHADAARTHGIGCLPQAKRDLVERTRQSFFEGVKKAVAGGRLFDISQAIEEYIRPWGYGIVRDLVGHGIGRELHEDPQVPNFAQARRGPLLRPGMTLAIEPMINLGRADVDWLEDGWTVVSSDRSVSAHYENTILITEAEPEILTWEGD